jgi:hypothetical protein
MSIAFYMDHHVPSAVTRGLRLRGVDCLTAEDDGRADFADPLLLDRATDLGRVIFTQDRDFLAIGAERVAAASPSPASSMPHNSASRSARWFPTWNCWPKSFDPPEMENRIWWLPI